MIGEADMRKQFAAGYDFPPLRIELGPQDALRAKNDEFDAILAVTVEGRTFDFAAEFTVRNSPRVFAEALFRIERAARRRELLPMLVAPYLRENQLDELQRRGLSGVDLSGNGVVSVPGQLLVYRTGAPNKFPDSAPTKYAYRGVTSLVGRVFLCRAAYRSLADIESEIARRGGSVALSTISKALKRMESDLIVDRTTAGLLLRQPNKLLEKLAESYLAPKISRTTTLKFTAAATTPGDSPTMVGQPRASRSPLARLLSGAARAESAVLSGLSSLDNYAVMGRQGWPVVYARNIAKLLSAWGDGVEETSRFVDVELRETDDPTVYFDTRLTQNLPYASPVQAYVEAAAGDKRERETARQVQELILRDLKP